jgi:hypothetical protein
VVRRDIRTIGDLRIPLDHSRRAIYISYSEQKAKYKHVDHFPPPPAIT